MNQILEFPISLSSTQAISSFPGVNELAKLPGIQYYIWLLFLILALLLSFSSIKLVKNAEVIIAKTKFGGAFVGGALISVVTSLPEFITAISQALSGNASAGLSDDLGSNAFAGFLIMITALLFYRDLFLVKVRGFTKIIVLISLFSSMLYGIFLFFGKDLVIGTIGTYAIGIIPAIFLIIYLVATFAQYKYGDSDDAQEVKLSKKFQNKNVKKSILFFIFWGATLTLISVGLNFIITGMQHPDIYNIDSNSAGGLFLAITTSLPEIVAFLYFIRNKQPVAGFGTLIGSAIFNNSLIFWADLAYRQAPIIEGQAGTNTFGIAFLVMFLMALISLMIFFPKVFRKKRYYFIMPSIGVIGYFIGWFLILS